MNVLELKKFVYNSDKMYRLAKTLADIFFIKKNSHHSNVSSPFNIPAIPVKK